MQVGGQNYSQDASGFWTKDSDLSGPYVWDGAAMNLAGIGPADLFLNGEKGVWFDPSDLSTMFQDNAGTTPVTGVEQPVGLMLDKSQGLVKGPNNVINGGFDSSANWSVGTDWAIANGIASKVAGASSSALSQTNFGDYVTGDMYEIECDLIVTAGTLNIFVKGTNAGGFTTSGHKKFYAIAGASASTGISISAGASFVGSIDNVTSVRVPGYHASQATTASRPVLKARYNLLTKSEQFDDPVWVKQGSVVVANQALVDGSYTGDQVTEDATGTAYMYQALTIASGVPYKLMRRIKLGNHPWVRIMATDTGSTNGLRVWVNLETKAVGTAYTFGATPPTNLVVSPLSVDADGWVTISITATFPFTSLQFYSMSSSGDNILTRYNNGIRYEASAAVCTAADAALNIPAYQRVNTATDYDTVGFPYYLAFDGVDDSFATGNIDLSAVDEVSMFVGLNKGDDSAVRAVVEFTSNSSSVPGSFAFFAPPATTSPSVQFRSAGTQPTVIAQSGNTLSAPSNNVFTGHAKIATPIVNLRTDGVQTSTANGTQGTGNYANAPLYIGRRANASLPLAGRIYSLIIRAALPSTSVMKQIERYVGNKMGKVL